MEAGCEETGGRCWVWKTGSLAVLFPSLVVASSLAGKSCSVSREVITPLHNANWEEVASLSNMLSCFL